MDSLKIKWRFKSLLASACAMLLIGGCGGGEPMEEIGEARLQPALYSGDAASLPARANGDSITLQSNDEFRGFNPEIWNDRKTWYECDCGRHPQQQKPRKMEWDPI